MKKLRVLLATLVVSVFAFTGCAQIVKTEEGMSKQVVAKVYGEDMTLADFNKRFEPIKINIEHQYKLQEKADAKLKKEGKEVNLQDPSRLPSDKAKFIHEQKEIFLNDLTQERVLLHNAKAMGIEVKDSEIQKGVKGIIDQGIKTYGSQEKLEAATKETVGLEFDKYKEFLNDTVKLQLIQQKIQEKLTKDVKVSDKEVEEEYNKNPYAYTEKPNKLYFSHILIKDEAKAKDIKKQLDGGADFAKLAKQYSEDAGSKENGGRYAEGLEYASLDPAFITAALKLNIGEISQPVKGQHGYYIIKVEKKEEFKKLPLDKVKDKIKASLVEPKQKTAIQAELAKWEKESKIKKFLENLE
ncbi:MAG: peptidylprolyl isomerase [Niameybacter sp.]